MFVSVRSFLNRPTVTVGCSSAGITALELKNEFYRKEAVPVYLQRACVGGRSISDQDVLPPGSTVCISLSLPAGKGGFGSMLRAIGAQIEKTTNREACRDLSGRRLRDINEEKRLKEWISKQADREQETLRKKKEKLERMRMKPKHEFHDPDYDQERSELPEKVTDSVLEGLKKKNPATQKRKSTEEGGAKKKKNCMWLDDLEVDDSDSSEESDEENENKEEKGVKSGDEENQNKEKEGIKRGNEDVSCEERKDSISKGLDLSQFESIGDLQGLGEDVLSSALSALGAKCGGTLEQKAERLWALKGKGTPKKFNGPADIVL